MIPDDLKEVMNDSFTEVKDISKRIESINRKFLEAGSAEHTARNRELLTLRRDMSFAFQKYLAAWRAVRDTL